MKIFSSTGRRPASLCHGLLSVVRPCVFASGRASVCLCIHPSASVRALTFSLNIFFSETTYRILMTFHGNVPAKVKNCGCHGNKTEKKLKTLKIFLSETIRVRATKFGM